MDTSNGSAENLISAFLFVAIGTGAVIIAADYPIGSLRRMGPGLYPSMIGALLIFVGVGLGAQTLLRSRPAWPFIARPALTTIRAIFFVMLALLAFAVLIRPAGLIISTASLAFISTRAEPGHSLVGSLILSAALAAIAALIFVYGIGLPLRLWP